VEGVRRRVRMRLSLSPPFSFPCNCCVNVRESGILQLGRCMYRKNRQNMCKLTQSVFVSFTITYMRALKKHKILVINIFPLESFNGTIELKFKNPLVLSF